MLIRTVVTPAPGTKSLFFNSMRENDLVRVLVKATHKHKNLTPAVSGSRVPG